MIFTRQSAYILVVLLILILLVAHVFACERAETESSGARDAVGGAAGTGADPSSRAGLASDITQYVVPSRAEG